MIVAEWKRLQQRHIVAEIPYQEYLLNILPGQVSYPFCKFQQKLAEVQNLLVTSFDDWYASVNRAIHLFM